MKNITKLFLGTTLAFSSLLSSEHVSFAQEQQNVVDIGKNAKVYNSFSTIYNVSSQMKTSIQVSFIEDPNSNKKIAIISTAGSNIAADKRIVDVDTPFPSEPGENVAGLEWPSSYHIEMELKDNQSQFYKVAPANTVDTKSVTSSVGYTIGSGIKMGDKPDGGISGNVNWSTSVTYNQSDYKTFLAYDSDKKVNWTISFVSAMNQGYGPYDRDSYNPTYGNQLFMKSRNGSVWAKDNFISNEEMPGLASYGFSPAVIAVITTDKDTMTPSKLQIRYGRIKDRYDLKWGGVAWAGDLQKNFNNLWGGTYYEIDWGNHRLIDKSSVTKS
ncbi:beta-channel forming cytolysin [Bacillus thuringiensis serovar yunnanensis]|nr:beta-channel forming cytolysin [Bacillus thuringiensis serovar yunnanensis]